MDFIWGVNCFLSVKVSDNSIDFTNDENRKHSSFEID